MQKKVFDKIQYPVTVKSLKKLDMEGMYLNIKKSHVTNPELISPSNSTSSFIFEGKEIILLKRHLYFHVHEVLALATTAKT